MPSGTTRVPLYCPQQPVLPQKMVLAPTFLYHAITREEEKGGSLRLTFSPSGSLYTNSDKALAAFFFFFFFPFQVSLPQSLGMARFSHYPGTATAANQGRF